jgi:hypothetical protein
MAAEASDSITLYEAVKFLAPLVGGGGLTAIAVAYFGSRRPKLADQVEHRSGSVGIQALLADHMAMQNFTAEIKRLADAMEDLAKATNRRADLLDIARAVDRLHHNAD